MPEYSTEIQQLIDTVRVQNPSLYQALTLLNEGLFALNIQINPLVRQSQLRDQAVINLSPPASFTFSFPGDTLRLNWSAAPNAVFYEIRKGADWDTATYVLNTSSLQADLDPVLIGEHTYLIKSLSNDGVYSHDSISVLVTVVQTGAPIVTAQVIDNNVLLSWTKPTSAFTIDHYEIDRDGMVIGEIAGNFTVVFVLAAGNYTYGVTAVDIARNFGARGTLLVDVKTPPDFQLYATFILLLNGTYTDTIQITGPKILASIITESWDDHFINNSWTTIQDQIDAGYPLYQQPSKATGSPNGSYEEKIDYGGVFSNLIVSITYNYNIPDPGHEVTIVIKMAVSDDDISYSAFTTGAVQFFGSLRYLKVKLEFTAADDRALVEVFNVVARLDVKREQDGGIVNAVSTDATGTTVNFNKPFKDIDSIDVSLMGTTAGYATVNFTDVPSPTSFKVLAFNSIGVRVTADVRWIARGII